MFLLIAINSLGPRVVLQTPQGEFGDAGIVFESSPTLELDFLREKIANREEFTIPKEGRLRYYPNEFQELNIALGRIESFYIEQNGRQLTAMAIMLSPHLITICTPKLENLFFDQGEIKISFKPFV